MALVLNFTTAQRTWLLTSPATLALLYTPANEHFGIIPVEGMVSRLPVLACDSGGPTESIVDPDVAADAGAARTGWLRPPEVPAWSAAILEIVRLSDAERSALGERARQRALTTFSQDAMARSIQDALEEAVNMGEMKKGGLFFRGGVLVLCMVLAIAMWQRL